MTGLKTWCMSLYAVSPFEETTGDSLKKKNFVSTNLFFQSEAAVTVDFSIDGT